MIYGLYLSATGVLTNSYRQDLIANNLANSETVGFKKDLAVFQERATAAHEKGGSPSDTNALLEGLGGGLFASPTYIDHSQGEIESTGNPLDVAIEGNGFFAVQDQGQTRLTRAGHFQIDRDGFLSLPAGPRVLGANGQPIALNPNFPASIDKNGDISQDRKNVGRVGLFDTSSRNALRKHGGSLMHFPDDTPLAPATGTLHAGNVKRGNVKPATELAALMDAQRRLEANANMIHTQDITLGRLVNDVGKIS